MLQQGIPAPDAPLAGPEKLPAALPKGPSLHSGSLVEPHLFLLPPNTAGEATLKKRPPVRLLPLLFPIYGASYTFYCAWTLTGDGCTWNLTDDVFPLPQPHFTFSYTTFNSHIQSSCSLQYSTLQEKRR
ncbi:hypothetical protein VZT92_025021 [Zoarces viviparus]|uniref:Uncharacterized protein n=1 Tax=Zoarces viviparus TaxID=48416 RepID=A0AAW1E4B4_ZOAVI